jgi:hypothetical protein
MDAYGLAILGNITVENDNLYIMGGPSNRMANIYSVYFTGIATSSWYADLAEKYSCNSELPIGTVVAVSDNEAEVERCSLDCDPAYVGVVSKNPGFLMGDRKGGLITGLMGKLPVSVVGKIKKKDFIVPTTDGCARAGVPGEESCKIGISLETIDKKEAKLVTCIIR